MRDGDLPRVAKADQVHDHPGPHQAARAAFWGVMTAVLDEHNTAVGTFAISHKGSSSSLQKALGSGGISPADPVLYGYGRPRSSSERTAFVAGREG